MPRATYEDVLNAPEKQGAGDPGRGAVPEPATGSAACGGRFTPRRVLGPFDNDPGGPGGWWILDGPELHFGEHVVVPTSRAGGGNGCRDPGRRLLLARADWVCEVLSPSTARIDRTRKLRIYAGAGVAYAWLVNATERTLEVLRLRDGAWTIVAVFGDADRVSAEPFGAVPLELGRLWRTRRGTVTSYGRRAWYSGAP